MRVAGAYAASAAPFVLPRLGLGAMTFGDPVDSSGARGLIEQALDAGAVMVDTANVYSSGQSETILGEVLPGIRNRVVLATKVGIPTSVDDTAPLSGKRIRSECEGSLRRLGTDHIDLYYLHKPDRATPFEESLAAVASLISEGKVRDRRRMRIPCGTSWPSPVNASNCFSCRSGLWDDVIDGPGLGPSHKHTRGLSWTGGVVSGDRACGRSRVPLQP